MRFIGEPEIKLLNDGRNAKLLNTIVFYDSNDFKWVAPAGIIVDGASIPRFFWRVIGSPFVGKYRRASIIHDYYCVKRNLPHPLVHKMFYEAMLCDGVGKSRAWIMYQAVKIGGPRWVI